MTKKFFFSRSGKIFLFQQEETKTMIKTHTHKVKNEEKRIGLTKYTKLCITRKRTICLRDDLQKKNNNNKEVKEEIF